MPTSLVVGAVTCVLCGGLADERRSIKVNPDNIHPALRHENPKWHDTIREIADELGVGEAHTKCFDRVVSSDKPVSEVNLEQKDHRYLARI